MTDRRRRKGSRGFTLIELMIVVAIIAVLASIAGLAYVQWVNEAKKTEAVNFLSAIRGKEMAYRARYGRFISAAEHPSGVADGNSVPWGTGNVGFQTLGVRPGKPGVRFSYIIKSGGGTVTCAASSPVGSTCTGIVAAAPLWFWAKAENSEYTLVVTSANDTPFDPR